MSEWRGAVFVGVVLLSAISWTMAADDSSFSPAVSADGAIVVPDGYENWPLLGVWSIAAKEESGAEGLHYVYSQPETIDAYRRDGNFPDGAILVKELRGASTRVMSTGTVSQAGPIQGWFVMVKDEKKRFSENPLWGNGWGWAYFDGKKPLETITSNYRNDCLACHVPAKATDWVFVEGYPILSDGASP